MTIAHDELASALSRRRHAAESTVGGGPLPAPRGKKLMSVESSGVAPTHEARTIFSPAAFDSPAANLLTRCVWNEGRESHGPFDCAIVYLHGFPDQSLSHQKESDDYGLFSSRFPRKLAEAVLRDQPGALFVAFNFSGTPGSDRDCPFAAKTVSREVSDARAVVNFLRESGRVPLPKCVHVVGLSTGAIVAALMRGCDPRMTVTTFAGLVDASVGLKYDFDDKQLCEFDRQGSCLKEFWLPYASPSNPPVEGVEGSELTPGKFLKSWLRLDVKYREDFLQLDIAGVVSSSSSPLLVIHGDADDKVPVENGRALFEIAAEPKQLLVIPGGNHFMSSDKHFKKATAALNEFVKSHAVKSV